MARENRENIYVTGPFLPTLSEYEEYLVRIWDSRKLTNNGPLLQEFESVLQAYLELGNFRFVTNGTLALQLALSALGIDQGEIITTPFSYVATTSAIVWQHCTPVYVDIDPHTLCLDATKIEAALTSETKAILPVHVFGNACQVEAIEQIAAHNGLKVIYDAAHAFGSWHKGRSLASFGDVSTLSFHATKLFHTIEGGGIVCKDPETVKAVDLQKQFGHYDDEHFTLGINAKASEFQAAMGLANLAHVAEILEARKDIYRLYGELLPPSESYYRQTIEVEVYNCSYVPLVFRTEELRERVAQALSECQVFPRRYFYPSLNELPYLSGRQSCANSESIARRILCLPSYFGLSSEVIYDICQIILKTCDQG